MSVFRIFLIGSSSPIEVELDVSEIREIEQDLLTRRYLRGFTCDFYGDADCRSVLIPAGRIQLIIEI